MHGLPHFVRGNREADCCSTPISTLLCTQKLVSIQIMVDLSSSGVGLAEVEEVVQVAAVVVAEEGGTVDTRLYHTLSTATVPVPVPVTVSQ